MTQLTFHKICLLLGLPVEGLDFAISSVQYDSRKVSKGDLFCAIEGAKVDGHLFLEEAKDKGAICALVSKKWTQEIPGLLCIYVEDVLDALQQLAKKFLEEHSCRVIAITGSVGKTTTKEFIATLLEEHFVLAKTPGSVNSQVGLPAFLLSEVKDQELLILEMGMNHPGEISKLVQMAPPEIAVVTKIALAHAAFFPEGLEAIAQAKAEIFSHPKTSLGILSVQALQFAPFKNLGAFRKVAYGNPSGEYTFLAIDGELEIYHWGTSLGRVKQPLQAEHFYENFVAACSVALELGVPFQTIQKKARELKTCQNRFELIQKEGICFLNDSYNANPTSMRAALENLPKPKENGKVIAVLGEMRELGSFSQASHLEIGKVAFDKVEHLLCLGKECEPMVTLFQKAGKPAELFVSLEEVKKRLVELAKVGDVVLLKGSNSHQLWKLLGNL